MVKILKFKKNLTYKIITFFIGFIFLMPSINTYSEDHKNMAASSNNKANIDLSSFPVCVTVDKQGGTVTLPGGPSIEIPKGALNIPVVIALRPTSLPPSLKGTNYVALTPWFDIATDRLHETTSENNPFSISVPVIPPTEAQSHPGLEVRMYLNGIPYPIDGSYQANTGQFKIEMFGLPESATFAVTFNPNIVSYRSDEIGDIKQRN